MSADIYEKIRNHTTMEALKTGKRWILTTGGVPHVKLDAKEVIEAVAWFKKVFEDRGPPLQEIGLTNFISGTEYDWKGMKQLAEELDK